MGGFLTIINVHDWTSTDTEEEQSYAEKLIFPKMGIVVTLNGLVGAVE